jgi:hypothetical protein
LHCAAVEKRACPDGQTAELRQPMTIGKGSEFDLGA